MARQGRFGRSTAGSQNLSSLIYSLLREERNDQEDTMIRSYRNNMRGGVSTNTFSSGGTTTSATANSVYQWYLDQANLARQSGDNLGYNSLMQRAEEFRIAALGDQEMLLSNSFQNGTSIDFSLFGGTGSGTLTLPQFETLMTNLANNPSLTETDRSRIRLTLFTASLNSTAGELARGYDEGTKTANDLVAFYDKELERARAAGVTTDSQLYQNLLNARSRYIKAGQVDAANARVKAVESGIKDEMLAVAKGLQSFLMPIIEKRFNSAETINALKAKITGDGFAFLKQLTAALGESKTSMYQLIYDAAVAGNYTQEQIDTILQSASVFSTEATRLAKLYPDEAETISTFARQLSEAAALGGFQALGRTAAQEFQDTIASTGGVVGVAGSSDPYSTLNALKQYAQKIGTISENPTYDDVVIADTAFQFASGNFGIGSGDGSVKAIIDEIGTTYPNYDKQNISIALAELLSGNENAWQSKDALYRTVARWIQGNGLEANDLLSPVDPTIGGITLGQVMQYAVESEMTRMVDEDPNLVYAYRYIPELGTTRFTPTSVAEVKNDPTYMPYTTTGKGQELVYVQRIRLKVSGGGDSNIYLVPMPGGEGTFSAGATGDMDSNDYIEFNIGTASVKLTLQDLQEIETHSGQTILPPRISKEDPTSILISPEAYKILVSTGRTSPVTAWLFNEAETRGQEWFNSKFSADGTSLGSNTAINEIVASYVAKVTPLAQSKGDAVDVAALVSQALSADGINDKTGKLSTLIISQIDPVIYTSDERRKWYAQFATGGRGGGIPEGTVPPWERQPGATPTPPAPSWDYSIYPQGRDYGNNANPYYVSPTPAAPTFGPENLTPDVLGTGPNPNALPGYANPGQLAMPQISGDFFFRKISAPQSSSGPIIANRPSRFGL